MQLWQSLAMTWHWAVLESPPWRRCCSLAQRCAAVSAAARVWRAPPSRGACVACGVAGAGLTPRFRSAVSAQPAVDAQLRSPGCRAAGPVAGRERAGGEPVGSRAGLAAGCGSPGRGAAEPDGDGALPVRHLLPLPAGAQQSSRRIERAWGCSPTPETLAPSCLLSRSRATPRHARVSAVLTRSLPSSACDSSGWRGGRRHGQLDCCAAPLPRQH
jgi:hypothetical protein